MKRAKESPALQSTGQSDIFIPTLCNQNGLQIQFITQNVNSLNTPAKGIKTDKKSDHSTTSCRLAAPSVTVESADEKPATEIPYTYSIKPYGFFKVSKYSAFDRVVKKDAPKNEKKEALSFK